ncbi:sigma-70 family RNA polymerase sigma factor [Bacillus sp. 1P06AnD]|uniref:sigma-70 family RNA polymerase sigma factor n=1 Tax=Bacillus sp. 1P06AnD TaxID=3132208 RepID=UPI0039A02E96
MEDFTKLAEQYHSLIYRIIHNLHIYKDIDHYYSIGLTALWEAQIHFIRGKASFSTYAYATIRGRMLTELRKNKQYEDRQTLIFTYESLSEMVPSVTDAYFEKDSILEISKLLTENQRNWLIHTYVHGHSLTEIAHHFNKEVGAIKSWRRSALRKLQNVMDIHQELT